jgi:hypothetical protein
MIHGHIQGDGSSLVDVPFPPHGLGDAAPLTRGLTNGTVLDGRIGVHEIVDGRLQFRMIKGTMTERERKSIQQNLNIEQRGFQKP